MNILITGANGFVGKNLCATLRNIRYGKDRTKSLIVDEIYEYDRKNTVEDLKEYTKKCDFIVNLAGVNRPKENEEFYDGNTHFVTQLCNCLMENNNTCPIIMSSSIQVGKENDYAKSKKEGEEYLKSFSKKHGNEVYIYRLSNLFGKWSKPNYNSVVATWCYNIANDLDIQISNPNCVVPLCYIDDVINEIIKCMEGKVNKGEEYLSVGPIYSVTLKELSDMIKSFKSSRNNLMIPDQSDDLSKKLYSTYLSYLPKNRFSYSLKMNIDERGSFSEFLKTREYGQISINVTKPGIIKGQHWHHTKNEKFLVVSGEALIKLRKIGEEEVIEYKVSGDDLEVVDIPVGYTHNIENIGSNDLVTVIWANEAFDPQKPDTYYEIV